MDQPIASDAIYVIPVMSVPDDHVRYAVTSLQGMAARCILICPPAFTDLAARTLGLRAQDVVLALDGKSESVAAGYKQGLLWLWQQDLEIGQVILTGAHVIGPILPLDPRTADVGQHGSALFAPYWHDADLDYRFRPAGRLGKVPSLDFAIFSKDLVRDNGFKRFWQDLRSSQDSTDEFSPLNFAFGEFLSRRGLSAMFPQDTQGLQTYDPSWSEIDKLVYDKVPCLPISVLQLDPILHDLCAINLRRALDLLRTEHPQIYRLIIGYASRNIPPRDFAMIADQYEVLPHTAADAGKTQWNFGRIAVFIHAYYAEMMPEFGEILARLPCEFDVFITTSSQENCASIEEFLESAGIVASQRKVVVVEQNRGRDMASLFITFRDIVLSGRYQVALRLHSKRTPQVSRQVGDGFKEHLVENLVGSRGYVSNLLDRLEQDPDIGLIMPPVVQIGFGTLGHAWFNNRWPLVALAEKMGLKVNFDPDTPLAPLGTMYWFRTEALRKMFEWPWAFEDYNLEPHHIDGGLAHVQERLIGYVCVDRGFRVLMVMTPEQAGRNYAKVEYKLQLLAARLASGNVIFQRDQLDQLRNSTRAWVLRKLMESYGAIVRRYPTSRRWLRPVGQIVRRVLNPHS